MVLEQFIRALLKGEENLTHIEIDLLDNPYTEFTWLFTYLVGKDSTTFVLMYVLYVLNLMFKICINFY